MSPSRRLRVYWERYAAPTRTERDAGFRAVLDAATGRGLRVAGLFGVAALVGAAVAVGVTTLIAGGDMVEATVEATLQIGRVLTDKLFVFAAAAVFLAVARFRPRLTVGRWLVAAYVLVAAGFLTADDVARADIEFLAAWLSLLLLLTVGTVPFQPVQTLALGLLITIVHTGATAVPGMEVSLDVSENVRRIAYLVLVTFLCTVMNGALYAGRYGQYRVTERLARLRDRLERRSQLLETRGAELEAQQAELESSLGRLSRAQTQLVQQEKMASLGQLTAGVAHELKNPLNFVNNFAQLSAELLDDFEDELREDDGRSVAEALGASGDLLDDLRANAAKIREHGRRADGIIRSMLAHSRATPGPHRPAPLNGLLEEYVGLAYHGMRAEHTGFNVEIEKSLDPAVGDVEMVPEEMGRVFLNLLDNALQATRERAADGEPDYAPRLSVATRPLPRGGAEVRVSDNGRGIPDDVLDRIFEPFFTTKPTGEGTGLGLSLTYEIVVHGHGGTLDVETAEGEGTTFVVSLPGEDPAATGGAAASGAAASGMASGGMASGGAAGRGGEAQD
ncbi:ATP-binding protein [Rubrivirga sp. S365]|uniref:histidine kinase n=1 Tax=Rubrivirga litoralis TaxID=3075598 RepID=A0ABU3BRT9_9BACT|nr:MULTISPECIES: ATP-binding protein [unclassified Rubrivirga]MDT0631989.1 ATP-binding protein [Rubrivirga sp. F394]MDT7855318.1 ATP-binding protein [Rubrivirga sp. S365]